MVLGAFRGWVRIVRGGARVARFAAYPRCWADVLEVDEVRAIANAVAVVVMLAASVSGEAKECTRAQAREAEAAASSLTTWGEILSSFRRFGHCDDGAVAEGYSVSVVGMLANRWGQVSELEKVFQTEPSFRGFVLRHIDVTAGQDEFNRLVANAAVRCPQRSAATCEAILKRAQELQREVQRVR